MKAEDTVMDLTDTGNYSLKVVMTSILNQQAEVAFKVYVDAIIHGIKHGQEEK